MNPQIIERVKNLRSHYNYKYFDMFDYCHAIAFSKNYLFVLDQYHHHIYRMDMASMDKKLICFQIQSPFRIVVNEDQSECYVSANPFEKLYVIDFEGHLKREVKVKSKYRFIRGMDVDKYGNLYLADYYGHKILRIDKDGKEGVFCDLKKENIQCPHTIMVTKDKSLLVSLGDPKYLLTKAFFDDCDPDLRYPFNLLEIKNGKIANQYLVPVKKHSLDKCRRVQNPNGLRIFYDKNNVPCFSSEEFIWAMDMDGEGNYYFLDAYHLIKGNKALNDFEVVDLRDKFLIKKKQILMHGLSFYDDSSASYLFILDVSQYGILYRLKLDPSTSI